MEPKRDQFGFLEQVADVLPPAQFKGGYINHFTIGPEQIRHMRLARQDGDKYAYTAFHRTYTRLVVDGQIMMTDSDMERYTNSEFVNKAHGDVLIAGLGIGMVLHALRNPKRLGPPITSITVIEQSPGIVEAVTPSLPPGTTVICADIDTWVPTLNYDTIYFDIWPNRSTNNIPHINELHKRFRPFLRKGGWMGSWYHKELLNLRRAIQRDSKKMHKMLDAIMGGKV